MIELDVVTGAFGYTGGSIAERLLASGRRVRTITGHPDRPNPFDGRVEVLPFDFERRPALVEHLRGADTLYNTYWVFGRGDILINDIAYLLRRLPVFGIPGSGSYRIRPVSVEDLAELCVRLGADPEDRIVDAVGPETFTFEELVRLIARTVGSHALIVRVAPRVALAATSVIGRLVGDVAGRARRHGGSPLRVGALAPLRRPGPMRLPARRP